MSADTTTEVADTEIMVIANSMQLNSIKSKLFKTKVGRV